MMRLSLPELTYLMSSFIFLLGPEARDYVFKSRLLINYNFSGRKKKAHGLFNEKTRKVTRKGSNKRSVL